MPLFRSRDAADTLEDLLDRERAAILGGRFDLLSRMMAEKERLIRTTMAAQTENRMAQLRRKADRNHAMLLAASRGVQAVAKRLGEVMSKQRALQTYDRAGQRSGKSSGRGTLERRA